MMENLRKEVEDSKTRYNALTEELTSARIEQKDIDLTVQQKQERLKGLQGQMMAIKTNKEYDALFSEIDKLKEDITDLESRGLELLELIENNEKEIAGMEDQMSNVTKVNTEQLSSLQEQIDSVGSKIESKEAGTASRSPIKSASVLFPPMNVFGKVRAVPQWSRLKKRACGACYKSLPPQRIQEFVRVSG
jgi:predicted  nucleic acid-binding Zn-ribbon protein